MCKTRARHRVSAAFTSSIVTLAAMPTTGLAASEQTSWANHEGDRTAAVTVCESGLTTLYNGSCEVNCPHPLYTGAEYEAMRDTYALVGLAGGLLCFILLVDTCVSLISSSKRSVAARKSRAFVFQVVGSATGFIYFLIGPLQILARPTEEPVGCRIPVIPEVLHPSDEGPGTTLACEVNRVTIYPLMMLLVVVLVHMTNTHNRLTRTSTAGSKGFASRLLAKLPSQKRGLCACLGIIGVLCAVMCAVEAHMKTLSPHYQGSLVRFSFFCGPRLDLASEILLIKLPVVVLTLLIVTQTIRMKLLLQRLIIISETELSSSAVVAPLRRYLRRLSSAMTTFGFLCGLFGVLYIVCDGIVEAELNASADEFADWVQCRQNATFSGLYTLQGGCEEVLNRVGGSTISTANFAARPPIALVVSAHVLEAALVVVFGVLHCWTIYQRRFNADASVSLSVSYKRRRRRHH